MKRQLSYPCGKYLSVVAAVGVLCLLMVSSASASKEVVAYFGASELTGEKGGEFSASIGDVAVNGTGAGPADRGDIYVADYANKRIQRFSQDDNGTPGNPYDDTYDFVAAWGAGVQTGGSGYEICTVAETCRAGVTSSGNGGISGEVLASTYEGAVAVDEDTGQVYVFDENNYRVVVYAGDGTFLRAFGFDVVASGPGNTGTGYEICVAADGDICKAGVLGDGIGQITATPRNGFSITPPDGNPATGKLFAVVGSGSAARINTYNLDGSSPGRILAEGRYTFASAVAVDSRGIVYIGNATTAGQPIDRYDTQGANGSVGYLAPIGAPPLHPTGGNGTMGLEIDPDSDGPGPDTDVLYVLRTYNPGGGTKSIIQQFGPVNQPGLTTPPTAVDDEHGDQVDFNYTANLGFDRGNGRLFVSTFTNVGGPPSSVGAKAGVYVLDVAGGPPTATLDSVDGVTATTANIHGTVDPNGAPPVTYRVEYSTDGINWNRTPETLVGTQETPQPVDTVLNPVGGGLLPGTEYHIRLVATKAFTSPVATAEKVITTLPTAPLVETVGSPYRTATTARLDGRVNPRGSATTYHFEYGKGPCDTTPCQSSPSLEVGSGNTLRFVSQLIGGLEPGTTYHYRLVADNGNQAGESAGGDRIVTTRQSDRALSHGDFPGPAGSDRAWEQVNVPDTGGNPVIGGLSFSDDGEKALYQIPGGTPATDSGSAFSVFYSERTPSGWQSKPVLPGRSQTVGPNWIAPAGRGDLSQVFTMNLNLTSRESAMWRLEPGGGTPQELLAIPPGGYDGFYTASDDGSRAVVALRGSFDPAHPASPDRTHLYDVTSGVPELVSLLPGDDTPACGVLGSSGFGLHLNAGRRPTRWLSTDGRYLAFPSMGVQGPCGSRSHLFLRDIESDTTVELDSVVSGSDCGAGLLKQTPGKVFLWTQTRMVASDSAPPNCTGQGGGDIYRYDIAGDTLECMTCVSSVPLDVTVDLPLGVDAQVAIAGDGSRAYFVSPRRLVAGAATPGIYRLAFASGDLAYVGPAATTTVGDSWPRGNALNPDGSVLIFRSSSAALNQVNGLQNGGTAQFYRYDDRDRSLTCVSCPSDGSAPTREVDPTLATVSFTPEAGPNSNPLDDKGETFIFRTTIPLVGLDQNTPKGDGDPRRGTDVYEWRDGRTLLVSDGLTTWPHPEIVPTPNGVSPDGRDVFFTASAQYTLDALDGYNRLYDARIGGGIPIPPPPKPCPLEVCQGTPQGAPENTPPGTGSLNGSGNVTEVEKRHRCKKGKVRRKGRCVKKHRKHQKKKHNRAHDDRRANR